MRKTLIIVLALMCLVIGAYAEEATSSDGQTDVTPSETTLTVSARVAVNGTVHVFEGYDWNGNYYFIGSDIVAALGDIDLTGIQTITQNDTKYYNLRETAETMQYDFTHDTVLCADYIWTYQDAALSGPSDDEFLRAVELGIAEMKDEAAAVTYAEFFTILDRVVELSNPDMLSTWQAQFALGRKSSDEMTRLEGMLAVLKCAVAIGGEYASFNSDWTQRNNAIGESVWNEVDTIRNPYRYIPNDCPYTGGGFDRDSYIYDWDDCGVAYRFSFGRVSLVSGNALFDCNEAKNSMEPASPLTYKAAALAAIRLYESSAAVSEALALIDPLAIAYDTSVITGELLERAKNREARLGGVIPLVRGMIIGNLNEITSLPSVGEDFRRIANWGFNSVRVNIAYEALFDSDVQHVIEAKLKQLDQIVASAIQNNLHLNILTTTMPGRTAQFDDTTFTSVGEFDLFTNPKRQAEAKAIWAMLAQRYNGIPATSLSFTPLFEAQNYNLSTGLPVDPYSPEAVANVYAMLVETIHQYDPDRLVIYEPTAVNGADGIISESKASQSAIEQNHANALISFNFCEGPFVYACMTADSGEHIDNNNHSMFIPEYPVTIYAAQGHIPNGKAMQFSGELVAGTQIELYLSQVAGKGKFEITADGNTLYSEQLSSKTYTQGSLLSVYYPFATSDKLISITLEKDVTNLLIRFSGDWFEWCGLNVILPESYALERWWYPTNYDAMLEGSTERNLSPYLRSTSTIMIAPNCYERGRKFVINPDITYTSEEIWEASTAETIEAWGQMIADFAPGAVVRFENANFGGCTMSAALKYYDDLLSMLDQYGFGWYANDYGDIVNAGGGYVGQQMVAYPGCMLNAELLQLMQKWQ